jgi:hypothetical protein
MIRPERRLAILSCKQRRTSPATTDSLGVVGGVYPLDPVSTRGRQRPRSSSAICQAQSKGQLMSEAARPSDSPAHWQHANRASSSSILQSLALGASLLASPSKSSNHVECLHVGHAGSYSFPSALVTPIETVWRTCFILNLAALALRLVAAAGSTLSASCRLKGRPANHGQSPSTP